MNKKFSLALAAVALLCILPLSGLFSDNSSEMITRERRRPHAPPRLETLSRPALKAFFSELDEFLFDRLGLRQQIMDGTARLLGAFSFSPRPDGAIYGLDDWLFLGNSNEQTLDRLTGRLTMSDPELQQRALFYENIARAAQGRGARFVLVIAPNKTSVYPEFLPAHVRPAPQRYSARLVAELRSRGIDVYDATPALVQAKGRGLLYYRTDSHWNYLGAYVAFEGLRAHLLNRLGLDIPPLPETLAFAPAPAPPPALCGDLLVLGNFYMPWRRPGESYAVSGFAPGVLRLEDEQGVREMPRGTMLSALPGARCFRVRNSEAAVQGRAWLLHDSFSGALAPYLHHAFQEVVYLHHQGSGKSLESIDGPAPDLVLWEVVERNL